MLSSSVTSPSDIDLSLYPPGTSLDPAGRLMVGGCAVADVAAEYGTPAYVLDEGALRARARQYREVFESLHSRSMVLFAAKSFPSAAIIGAIAEEGCGTDTAAEGELRLTLAGGQHPSRVVSHGNAKTDADIRSAIDAGIRYIVVDNADDVRRIARWATAPVPVLLRVIPELNARTHAAMMTGHSDSKFGVPAAAVPAMIAAIAREPMLELRGLHVHIGSQLTDLEQFESAVEAIARFGRFDVYDLGGGLGVRYVSRDVVPSVEEYAERLVGAAHRHLGHDIELLVEPGRSMVAQNMLTCYRVVTVKRAERVHVAVDGGMGDSLEVSLYGQEFAPSIIDRSGPTEIADIVGRHCESGDYLAHDVPVPAAEVGDLVTVPVTGAYCYTMANNFNGALRPPVVFCRDGRTRLAVRRETFDDLLRREQFVGVRP
ncbi:diaminopimelate decarboxylase [Microbacterium trichothecenolyticum]|uniref:Diaminopimelate decarboxylase n=1 Tax=Microbacterium trichothecenolyticum TaxID=69370 RepID=A0ABU0TUY3_MICTR|nr:diaminopimelate decarboxylase [Microbacterium trichothecenolyticum]MDQ1123476.1 diaminopimelate decarboxylase [Microbacterium trichothecenolyticum]